MQYNASVPVPISHRGRCGVLLTRFPLFLRQSAFIALILHSTSAPRKPNTMPIAGGGAEGARGKEGRREGGMGGGKREGGSGGRREGGG